MKRQPIAIFDSGVGGLTVAKEVFRRLPNEEIIYLGDTARVPYGTKSPRTVIRFASECVEFLLHFRPKMVIIACNTASSVALSHLRERVDVPIIGVVEPGARAALDVTVSKRIGVVGTKATVRSGAYTAALKAIDPDVEVYSNPAPLFVPLVEEGRVSGSVVEQVAAGYLESILEAKVDTLILGCTHYPVLKPVLADIVGAGVTLIDSAEAVSARAEQVLSEENLLSDGGGAPPRFFVTDVVDDFEEVGDVIWDPLPGTVERVELGSVSLAE
jgi:glutamate racemase